MAKSSKKRVIPYDFDHILKKLPPLVFTRTHPLVFPLSADAQRVVGG
jgi:hypothetical protein